MDLVVLPSRPRHRFDGCGQDYLLHSLVEASRTAHRVATGLGEGELAGRLQQVALDIDEAMRHLAEPVAAPLAEVAAPSDRDDVRRFTSLSYREHQVLDLISDGLTNRQIGIALGLAEKTIKNYVSALFAKLNVDRRTQAAVYGARHRQSDATRRDARSAVPVVLRSLPRNVA